MYNADYKVLSKYDKKMSQYCNHLSLSKNMLESSNFKVFFGVHNFTGVAVGCGWQAFVAYVNVGCYYIVGIPLGCVLGFKFDFGVKVDYKSQFLYKKKPTFSTN